MSAKSSSRLHGDDTPADLIARDSDLRRTPETAFANDAARQRAAQRAASPQTQQSELALLRRLLLGREQAQLAAVREDMDQMRALEASLEDPVRQTDRVAEVLSEAMLLRENRDQGISKALRPALSDAIKAAVRKNPEPVVAAVSPVIGPAIRRSVNEAIASMLELLDKLLEHNLSLQALKWRIEAWRSGRRYSELVLLRTLVYRVEQVLLIHHETGLLLAHVDAPRVGVRDPDLVGSMLTAINDFVSDSFSANEESRVQAMQVGDYKVNVEQGRFAVIAAIARGNPPAELARTVRETLETLEILYGEALERFDGDTTAFSQARPLLEDCLKSQQREAATKRPWLAPALLGLLLLMVLGYWGIGSYRTNKLWSGALDALRNEPGILIAEADREGDLSRIHGLRDPLSREPESVIGGDAQAALQWTWDLRPYLSTEPALVLKRASQVLDPPLEVALSLEGGVLELSGDAPQSWIDTMRVQALRVPGITGLRDDALNPIAKVDPGLEIWREALRALRAEPGILVSEANRTNEIARVQGLRDPLAREPRDVIGAEAESQLAWDWSLRPFFSGEPRFVLTRARQALRSPDSVVLSLEGSVLRLTGEATRQWVDTLPLAIRGIPGVSGYRIDDLRVIDDLAKHREAFDRYRREIEATALYFEVNAVGLAGDQEARLDTLGRAMNALVKAAGALELEPVFLVTGYADATGSRAQNRRLSFSRASRVMEELVARGVSDNRFLPVKMGIRAPDELTKTPEQRARNRRASIEVLLIAEGGGTAGD